MLDHFSIFTRGGLVLWTFQLTALKGNPIDALIQTCLLQERSGETSFNYGKDGAAYTLKWTFHNDLGLVFVAVYQRILQLLYVDELLASVRDEFFSVYTPKRRSYPGFDETFRQLLREAEEHAKDLKRPKQITDFSRTKKGQELKRHNAVKAGKKVGGSSDEDDGETSGSAKGGDSASEPEVVRANGVNHKVSNRESAFDLSRLRKRGDKVKQAATNKKPPGLFDIIKANGKTTPVEEGKKKGKANRVWDGSAPPAKQDFSDPNDKEVIEVVDVKTAERSLVDEEEDDIDSDEEHEESEEEAAAFVKAGGAKKQGETNAGKPRTSWLSSVFQSVAGKGALVNNDVEPALKVLKERLMSKNVAEEIADKLCESVAASLVGKKQASFSRISSTVRAAMEDALTRILTPKRSIDILRDVHAAKEQGRPYVITFVGVNGVGKSTNLAKVAYWLLQHDVSVMVAACDTFRAGAVEQLRTHSKRLGGIPLFERGYEKDPAAVAKEAIAQATRQKIDAVLVDTAGRMQDNEPLMRALSKLINQNEPDLVLFVGEALVGNDAVDQLSKFNQKLADLSASSQQPQAIDGILLTKFDTIDDKVGAALSMVYISGAPIMFVGCGQTYTDLKKLNVRQIIQALLK